MNKLQLESGLVEGVQSYDLMVNQEHQIKGLTRMAQRGKGATKKIYQRMTKSNESTVALLSPFVAFCHSLETPAPAKFV